jgi:hypothetical protein
MKQLTRLEKKVFAILYVLCLTFVFSSCQFNGEAARRLSTIEKYWDLVGARRLTTDAFPFLLECFSEGDDYLFVEEEAIRVGMRHNFQGCRYYIWDLDQVGEMEIGTQTNSLLFFNYSDAKPDNAVNLKLKTDNRFGWEIGKKALFYIEDMNADDFLPTRYNYDIWVSEGGELTILDQCTRKAEGETSYAVVNGERVPIVFEWGEDKTFRAYAIDGSGAQTQSVVLSGVYENTFMHATLHISEDQIFGGVQTVSLNAERYAEPSE